MLGLCSMAFLVSWTVVGSLGDRLHDQLRAGVRDKSLGCCVAAVAVVFAVAVVVAAAVVGSGPVAEGAERRFGGHCWHTVVEAVEADKSHGWQLEPGWMEEEGRIAE